MPKIQTLLSICFLWVLVSCNPSSKLTKQGDEKLKLGLYDEASVFYFNALLAKSNPKAKEGLAISAQKVLNEKFDNFNKLVVANNVNEAMKTYSNARGYFQNAASVGVNLRWPSEYEEVYIDIRSEYILKLYDEALIEMNEKRYEQAEQTFELIATLDSSYKGITVLRINTVLEPLYQHGLVEYEAGKYKQAYQTFSKIVLQDEGYKNAKQLKEEANYKATTTIGILPIYVNGADSINDFIDLNLMVDKRLRQKSYAYLKISDASEVAQQLNSRGWAVMTDKAKAIEAGKTLGLKYVGYIQLSKVQFKVTPLTTVQKSAYEAFSENILNPYTGTYAAITKFRKVAYEDTYEMTTLSLELTYSLISVMDGKIVLEKSDEYEQKDEVHQLVFDGNINNIYEELPTSNFLPPVNQAWRDLFTSTKRKPASLSQLSNEANAQMAKKIATDFMAYFK